ncbi:MAG: glycosyltransferase, partial [Raoultibacter sp.]
MSNPKVSIIVPVYNVAAYLGACLESLVKQTLSDIEIICIDDGSTDGSATVISSFIEQDSRVIGLSQQNSGV